MTRWCGWVAALIVLRELCCVICAALFVPPADAKFCDRQGWCDARQVRQLCRHSMAANSGQWRRAHFEWIWGH